MVLLPQSTLFLLVVVLVASAAMTLALLGLVWAAPVFWGLVKFSASRFIMNSFKILIHSLCISLNIVLFRLRLLCRSREPSYNFLLMSLGILSCTSCSNLLRATTTFTSGIVDLTRSLYFHCAPLRLLVVESFTLLYISGFGKGVFITGQFSVTSVFFSSSFCESPSLDIP